LRLNQTRADSARLVQGDLRDIPGLPRLVSRAAEAWGGLAALINNASAFYPTSFATASPADWDDLMTTNLKAPFFLCQAAAPYLAQNRGSIVNIGDIHAERTLPDYSIYSITKAGLAALTKSLAKELAPHVRVNGVAPGAILWPEATADPATEERVLTRVPLGTTGRPTDIAEAVAFLLDHAPYVTGQMLNVDGGRSLFS
jgi:pteridine reductase